MTGSSALRFIRRLVLPGSAIARRNFLSGRRCPDPLPQQPGFYRDASGALKRQAARFRIYGLNAAGVPVRELTAGEALITWHVHLANQKSAWYQFQLALDIPEVAGARPSCLRNAAVADRRRLAIDPGGAEISGLSLRGQPCAAGSWACRCTWVSYARMRPGGSLSWRPWHIRFLRWQPGGHVCE